MNKLTPVAQKVLAYAEKQMQRATQEIIGCEAKKKESFTYWVQWNFERMVAAETALHLWTVVSNAVLTEKSDEVTDAQIKDFLIRYRNDVVKQILQSTHKNSTNVVAVQIEIVQEDARKKFVGASCIDTGSLSELLMDVFGENVRGPE